jgi:hypothetical protein
MEAAVGEMVMLDRTAGATVSTADPDPRPDVAVIVVAPVATAVASPFEPEAFDTVAKDVRDEDQVTLEVRSWVLRSE